MQQRQCEVCRQLESERGFHRASREASETDRSKDEWRRRSESRGTRLERDFSSLCCSRAAAATATTAAVASPPTCSSRPWHGPFQCVCWFNLWPPRSSNSPGLFAISDKCVWPSTMGRLRHRHTISTSSFSVQFTVPVSSPVPELNGRKLCGCMADHSWPSDWPQGELHSPMTK